MENYRQKGKTIKTTLKQFVRVRSLKQETVIIKTRNCLFEVNKTKENDYPFPLRFVKNITVLGRLSFLKQHSLI